MRVGGKVWWLWRCGCGCGVGCGVGGGGGGGAGGWILPQRYSCYAWLQLRPSFDGLETYFINTL